MKTKRLLSFIDKAGCGLEIGPSYHPLAPKKLGYNVRTLDYLSQSDLIEKYARLSVPVSEIEPVDFIWAGEPYSELMGGHSLFDWIIASHVIEHTPDLIGFLKNCSSVLKEDGIIVLVVPDKRYCFDHFRPPSSIAQIIDAHHAHLKCPSLGMIADFYLNKVQLNGSTIWNRLTRGTFQFQHTTEETKVEMVRPEYSDVHAWSFTPHSFRLVINDLISLGYLDLEEVHFSISSSFEFFVILRKSKSPPPNSRLLLAKKAEAELSRPLMLTIVELLGALIYMPLSFAYRLSKRGLKTRRSGTY
jgi:SAM-dependent methyltransferase